jgi:hypothetical protein
VIVNFNIFTIFFANKMAKSKLKSSLIQLRFSLEAKHAQARAASALLPNYALSRPLRGRKICAKSAARHCIYFSVAQWVGLNCTLDLKQREAVDGRRFAGYYCNY